MIKLIQNLKIKWKLLSAFGSILLLSILLMLCSIYALVNIKQYQKLSTDIHNLEKNISISNTLIKDFLYQGYKNEGFLQSGNSHLIQAYDQNFSHSRVLIENLLKNKISSKLQIREDLQRIDRLITRYNLKFSEIKSILVARGFKDYGLEGSLRAAIHAVENDPLQYDKASMLMLRRHEKDFFLRKDLKYRKKFNDEIIYFQGLLNEIPNNSPEITKGKAQIKQKVIDYQKKFNKIINLEEQIGLDFNSGLRGDLQKYLVRLNHQMQKLGIATQEKVKNIIQKTLMLLLALIFGQVVVGLILVVFYSKLLSKAILDIKDAMIKLSKGQFPKRLSTQANDELGQTKNALNNLMQRIKTASDFALMLGEGNLSVSYDERFDDDVLARSIISMQAKLLRSEKEQSRINWSNKGSAMFNEILHMENKSLQDIGDAIIKQLIEYLNANQGALYLLDDHNERQVLDRISTYAYHKKKYVKEQIEIGEGLVGQVVREKDTLLLTDIPKDYIKITSGLGKALPSSILIVPLKLKDLVIGVIEIASFSIFESYEIQFVEKISESIANLLNNRMMTQQMQKLLKDTQQKAEKLTAQEEMLRQNTEELQTFQESMLREKKELEIKLSEYDQQ